MIAAISATGPCPYCRFPVPEEESCKLQAVDTGEVRVAHRSCRQSAMFREKADREWRAKSRLEALVTSWNYSTSNPLTTFPDWLFARFGNPEFMCRVSKSLAPAIANWSVTESLFVTAPTGAGKTSLVVARLHQRFAQLMAEHEAEPTKDRKLRFAFISGPALSGCRRRQKIGDESKLVELAVETPLLILDELGYEPLSEELLFVVDERNKRARSTVTTTGRTLESFVERYGGSLFRKLTQGGATIEGWKA